MKLLGVKDCAYQFNESPLYMEEILEDTRGISLIECDYNLVHNIIYAGLEFAEDYGFAPYKDFKTAQYILEEDSDEIPLIDVPLGDNGIPVLVVPHGENKSREMSILDKTTNGDYSIIFLDEDGNPTDYQDDDEDYYYDDTYTHVMGEIIKSGMDRYLKENKDSHLSPRKAQVITDVMYMSTYSEEELTWIDQSYDRLIKDPRLLITPEKEPEKEYEGLLAGYNTLMDADEEEDALHELVLLMEQYPDISYFWELYLWHMTSDDQLVDGTIIQEAYSRFPENTAFKALYAEWLAQEERADDVLEFFDHIPDLNALTTDNTHIRPAALIGLCCAYAMTWLLKGEVLKAEPYYQVITQLDYNSGIALDIQQMTTRLKMKGLDEVYKDEEATSDE